MKFRAYAKVVVVVLVWSSQGCTGWDGLWAEIPPYQGPTEPDASVDADDLADSGADVTPDTREELLDAPNGLNGEGSPEGVTLTWEPVDGATGFEVKAGDGEWTDVGDVTTWTDMDAPLGSFDGDLVISAADGMFGYKVPLEVTTAPTVTAPAEQTYEVRARGGEASSVTGSRTLGEESWTWQVAPADGGDFEPVEGVEGREGEYVADMPGLKFVFKATLTQAGVAGSVESGEEAGEGSKAVDLAVGVSHTCVLLANGEVVCWGGRRFGQTGDGFPLPVSGSVTEENFFDIGPTNVDIPGEVVRLEGNNAWHTCAVNTVDEVYCWGKNEEGQLGDRTTANSTAPVRMMDMSGAVEELRVWNLGTAVKAGGVWTMWGNRVLGSWEFPPSDGDIGDVSGFGTTICAVKSDSIVQCYQTGLNGIDVNLNPSSIMSELNDAGLNMNVASAGGAYHCWCVEPNTGTSLKCGGKCHGTTQSVQDFDYSVESVDLGGVDAFDVSGGHVCALVNGQAICWGENDAGQLGSGTQGTVGRQYAPKPVAGVMGAVSKLGTSSSRSCAVLVSGVLQCWGRNGTYSWGQSFEGSDGINWSAGGATKY